MADIHISKNDRLNAFCKDTDAFLAGRADGLLSDLTFAAKDIFDVKGYVTGGGNPDWKKSQIIAEKTAWAVQILVETGASMVGKTITDEITRGIFGENAHYGTPVNSNAPGRVPGGSSSGSAAAVAGNLVDFALGSDTGGSVRVPASFCGLYGLRPTHGRVSLDGVLPQADSYDTVGWFARDAKTLAKVGSTLLQSPIIDELPQRVVVAQDAFELLDEATYDALQPAVERICNLIGERAIESLAESSLTIWRDQQGTLQSREAWETVKQWIDETNPRFSFEVSERYLLAKNISDEEIAFALERKAELLARMEFILADKTIVLMPTTIGPAPPIGQKLSDRTRFRLQTSQLNCIAGTTGGPQINLPLADQDGLPVGISLLGSPGEDEMLIKTALELAK
ncbi:MAG: amidase [Pirellulaceae bacterium]|nr:amidase [Pirellulaceae bacterium]